jgi:hypothetical protein
MRTLLIAFFVVVAVVLVPVQVSAGPVSGVYYSTDMGGQFRTGHASTWRPGVNSGLPHVLHMQSWDGTNLGAQWDVSCPTEANNYLVQDNRVGGVGTIVYTSKFYGGTFAFYPGGWPWGDGSGTLDTTTMITAVQYVMIGGVSTPVASVVNGYSTGSFAGGCLLTFAIANGNGVGETSSLYPQLTKPATYPTFLDGTCGTAQVSQQFGTWGNVTTITIGIYCATPVQNTTWGEVKSMYR